MKLIEVEETESTNSLVLELAAENVAPFAVSARRQTAGRGQRGNRWESSPGANVTLSIYHKPSSVEAKEQFVISQAVDIAIVETLRSYMPERSAEIAIKWPNDIYVGNKKICGVLIENALNGTGIVRTVIGIGLNVNQREFLSDAPNPVSMWQLCGCGFAVDEVARTLCSAVEHRLCELDERKDYPALRALYFSMLWRADGFFPYIEASSDERFEAAITDIAPSGHITLTDRRGASRIYAFKEVQAVL